MYNMPFSHLLTDLLGKIRQHLGYFDLLGAYLFAGTALQALSAMGAMNHLIVSYPFLVMKSGSHLSGSG